MAALYIPSLLNRRDRTQTWHLETHFPELATLLPVKGQVSVQHCTTYLEVRGQADAIVTLTCDRCLQQYNHRLAVETTELIWLEEPTHTFEADLEREVSIEDLVETISPQGHFEPETWLYEQLCLALPQRQICDPQCPGIQLAEDNAPEAEAVDHRWSALALLKQQLTEEL